MYVPFLDVGTQINKYYLFWLAESLFHNKFIMHL